MVVDGLIYVIGGTCRDRGLDVTLSSAELFRPDGGEWVSVASMHTARSKFALSVVDRKIYVCGGSQVTPEGQLRALDHAEYFDVATGLWVELSPMSTSNGECSGFLGSGFA